MIPRRAYNRWVARLDFDYLRSIVTVPSWLVTGAATFFVLGVVAYYPPAQSFLGFDPVPPFFAFVPLFLLSITVATLWSRGTLRDRSVPLFLLGGNMMMMFYLMVSLAYSEGITQLIFVTFLLFSAAFQGHALRPSLRLPFSAIATLLGLALACLLLDPYEDLSLIIFLPPAVTMIHIVVGQATNRWDERHKENENLRMALQAQMLDEQAEQISDLSQTLADVLGYKHDINNNIQVLKLNSYVLGSRLDEHGAEESLIELADDLQLSIDKLYEVFSLMLDRSRRHKRSLEQLSAEPVHPAPLTETLLENFQRRFPQIRFELHCELPDDFTFLVCGGELTLERILTNLLRNACEGDGNHHAQHIELRLSLDTWEDTLLFRLRDDGPGFPQERLDNPRLAFHTSKSNGTGLGLFTVARLVTTNQAQLHLSNDDGAVVQLRWPLLEPTSSKADAEPKTQPQENEPQQAHAQGAHFSETHQDPAEAEPDEDGTPHHETPRNDQTSNAV